MNSIVRGSALLIASAILAACAAHREEGKTPASKDESLHGPRPAESQSQRAAAPAREAPLSAHAAASDAPPVIDEAQIAAPPSAICCAPIHQQPVDTERYQHIEEHSLQLAAEHPVSTFSIDVDTGAYANVRRFLHSGRLPPQDAVRVEEMINYFDYHYPSPASRDTPFRVATELAPAPWNSQALLLRIGIKGYEVAAAERPPANLVFLIDVSGSMQSPDKLPLLKNALRLLSGQLTARDRVSLVVYAGSAGVVLEPTPGEQQHTIRAAIERLEAGGSTHGAAGIQRAYELARAAWLDGGINRIVLATDGDFNVGVVSFEALLDLVERQRASGIALTTLGFGTGNYNDELLERLADAGNGNHAYIDTLAEARKVLVSQLSSTLFTIAQDVKIQVEFNPAQVLEYRLIGYENRRLAREDFNNDAVDAGEIGAGHSVTALYEVVPAGKSGRIEPLRYAPARSRADAGQRGELAHVRLRYKIPGSQASRRLEYAITAGSAVAPDALSADFRFAASVAAFGQLLRGGKYLGDFGCEEVVALARGALAEDAEGYRREFLALVELAAPLLSPAPHSPAQVGSATF